MFFMLVCFVCVFLCADSCVINDDDDCRHYDNVLIRAMVQQVSSSLYMRKRRTLRKVKVVGGVSARPVSRLHY